MPSSLHYISFETTDLIVTAHILLPWSPPPAADCLQTLMCIRGNVFGLLSHASPPPPFFTNRKIYQFCPTALRPPQFKTLNKKGKTMCANEKQMRPWESAWCIWLRTRLPHYRETHTPLLQTEVIHPRLDDNQQHDGTEGRSRSVIGGKHWYKLWLFYTCIFTVQIKFNSLLLLLCLSHFPAVAQPTCSSQWQQRQM